jgi:DNA primase
MTEAIRELAQQYLKRIKPSGNENIMAICPFHRKADGSDEKTPSFSMNVNSGLWYCHSCHARGNLYTFLRDIGLSRSGIDLLYKQVIEDAQKYIPEPIKFGNIVEPCEDILEESFLGLFDGMQKVPDSLAEDGLTLETLQAFDVGLDTKHARITFPLRNSRGELVGISGRATADGQKPRYKIYDKEYTDFGLPERRLERRSVLWNYHNVATQLRFETDEALKFVVIAEGFKAVMKIAQAGISTVVGAIGSYLTSEQKVLLEALDAEYILFFDNDEPGIEGQQDAVFKLLKIGRRVHVATYTKHQPSDLNEEEVQQAILDAKLGKTWLQEQIQAMTNPTGDQDALR